MTLILAGFLAGCAVGPDFKRPPAPDAMRYTPEPLPAQTAGAASVNGEAQRLVVGQEVSAEWWTLFSSPALSALVEQALKANPDVQAAQAALRQAQENVYAQEGVLLPSIQANVAATRQKNAVQVLSPTLTSGAALFNLYTPQVTVTYLLDAWGGNRRQVESLQAQAEVEGFQLEATYLTLTSSVVAAAVQMASLRAQIAALDTIIKLESEQLAILQRQNDLGAIAVADVMAQEAALAQSQAALPPLQKQLAVQRDLLARLVGRLPSDELVATFDLKSLRLPQDLPVSLPSKLVEQRPDVRAAEAGLHAASAQVGVATANMLPQITLSASAGSASTQFRQLFSAGTGFWGIAAGLAQPLFQGGTLLHRKRAAEAAFDQAAAQYRGAVLTAFQNVADALWALQSDADAVKASARAERAAAQSLAIAQKTMQLGASSYVALLNAEQTYQQALISLAQAQGNRYADSAALFQALGGGWWNRLDIDNEERTTSF
jgi:NodT family efflux transporter outer membrane factor (OMF) lipoprotein